MNETFSYIKAYYGRNGGSTKVTRYFKIDDEGKICYVEERVGLKDHKEVLYRVGSIKFLNFTQSKIISSSEKEYTTNLELALKQIS